MKLMQPRLLRAGLATVFAFGVGVASSPARAAMGDDMLKPDQLPKDSVSSKPTNDSGAFVGGGFTFGQAYSTEDGASPALAAFGNVEAGFQMSSGSWRRLEFSAELLSGTAGYRYANDSNLAGKATLAVPFGVLAKFGYGYSLGGNMFGLMKFGVGPVIGKFKLDAGNSSYSSGSLSGLAYQLGWEMVVPASSTLDFTAGLSLTQMQFDVRSVSDGGANQAVDRSILTNLLAADIGIRLRL